MEEKYSPKTRNAGTAAKRSIKIRIKNSNRTNLVTFCVFWLDFDTFL